MTIANRPMEANTSPRLFGGLKSRVAFCVCSVGSEVVGPVERLISGVVEVWGRMLVSISPDTGPDPNLTVPASPLIEPESPISAVPSVRQKVSASSNSTRLHWGQRFING